MLASSSTAALPIMTLGLSPVKRIPLSDGVQGTAETIEQIRKLVHQGMCDQLVNRTAIAIVRAAGIQQFDFLGEIKALFNWQLASIRFVRDITGVETLRTAREILQVKAGDCDDQVTLLASLLMTIGHHVRLVTVKADPREPRLFSHIYCEVEVSDGCWVPLDTARRNAALGRGPRQYFSKRVWSLTDSSYSDVSGLAGYGYSRSNPSPRGRLAAESPSRTVPQALPLSSRRLRRRGSRLGQDEINWSTFIPQLIGTAGVATANVITALNRPSVPSFVVNPATGLPVPTTPQGQLYASSLPGGASVNATGTIPNWMIYGLMALGVVLVVRK